MMYMNTRMIYLIRHGEPAFPCGEKLCIGRSELPLSPLGRMQACLLGAHFENIPLAAVFCSGMERTRDTARYIREDVADVPGLIEIDMGAWEGLRFGEIRQRWPGLYELRGQDPAAHHPPGGESFARAAARAAEAFRTLTGQIAGDIAVVAHGGVNQLLLCCLTGMPLSRAWSICQAYGCVNTIAETSGGFQALRLNQLPEPRQDRETCLKLLRAAGAAPGLIKHCQAAGRLTAAVLAPLGNVDQELAVRAALLHGLAHQEPDPPELASRWLCTLGYEREAELVARYRDLSVAGAGWEAKALYLAEQLLSRRSGLAPEQYCPGRAGQDADDEGKHWTLALAIMEELGWPGDREPPGPLVAGE